MCFHMTANYFDMTVISFTVKGALTDETSYKCLAPDGRTDGQTDRQTETDVPTHRQYKELYAKCG